MKPIFDQHRQLVAWLDPRTGHVFNTDMLFVAFVRDGALFSPQAHHLGFFADGVFRDKRAMAVAFTAGVTTIRQTPPVPPAPVRPPVPIKPATPAKPPLPALPTAPTGRFGPASWNSLLNALPPTDQKHTTPSIAFDFTARVSRCSCGSGLRSAACTLCR